MWILEKKNVLQSPQIVLPFFVVVVALEAGSKPSVSSSGAKGTAALLVESQGRLKILGIPSKFFLCLVGSKSNLSCAARCVDILAARDREAAPSLLAPEAQLQSTQPFSPLGGFVILSVDA